jgi:hemerythrin-like domain-containing protein
MNLMQSLGEEHKMIMAVLDAFEAYLQRLDDGAAVEAKDLIRFVVFFDDFADGWHHAREEDVLLPALTRHGYAETSGVLLHIREQHRRERSLFFRLKRVVAEGIPWSDERVSELLDAGRELIAFERQHIQKETDLLYPAASKELASDNGGFLEADQLWFTETHAPFDHIRWLERLGSQLTEQHRPS